MATKALHLEEQLCFSIYAAGHAFTRFYKPLLEPLGLTYPQYLVLLTLWEEDGLPLGAIGRRLGLDSGTLTPLLRRMEEADFITRRRDTDDERKVLVSLTPRGHRLETKVAAFPDIIGDRAGLSAREFASLRRMLLRLRDGLGVPA
jgi:DNA-binding MarR family transcriptional regulator